MLSVNTNTGAMLALQYLNKTDRELQVAQAHINTGLKVASAKDDGSTFAIAQNMRGEVAGFHAVADSLNRGVSAIDVAMSAGHTISDLLIEMKNKAVASADISLDTASREALNADFIALRAQINTIVENAAFNGTNLINGTVSGITALASADGVNKITVTAEDMNLSGAILTMSTQAAISTQATASAMITTINESLENVNAALARLGSGSKKFAIQQGFHLKTDRHVEHRHRQSGGRRPRGGKRATTVLAGQAATGCSGAFDRQPAAADHSLALPLERRSHDIERRRSFRRRSHRLTVQYLPASPGKKFPCIGRNCRAPDGFCPAESSRPRSPQT